MTRSPALANYRRFAEKLVVPDLTGLVVTAVLRRAIEIGFVLSIAEPPSSIEELTSHDLWVVSHQDPPVGAERYRMDLVVVWLRPARRGGDANDREPRTPLPRHHSGHGLTPADLH